MLLGKKDNTPPKLRNKSGWSYIVTLGRNLSPKAPGELTPVLRLLRSHSRAAVEEPTPLGGSLQAAIAGPAPREPR